MSGVTLASPFVAPARIGREPFARVLAEAGSPWAGEAGALYDLIVGQGHDPAVWLAICAEEHSYGTNRDSVLWRNDTRSWTNARTVRDPGLTGWEIVRDAVRGSSYVRYASVADSLRDGMYRVTDPRYRYVREGRTTIGQVLAIWSEGDSARYAAAVVRRVNGWMERETPMYDGIIPGLVDIRGELLTKANWDDGVERGPYETLPLHEKRGVVIHYRGVVTPEAPGYASFQADAVYHVGRNWARQGEAPVLGSGIMYHVGIGFDGEAYLLRDLDRVLWHCGAWPQNAETLAVQVPLGPGQRASRAQRYRLKEVCDAWLAYTQAPTREIWGHQELSPTPCPGTLLDDFVRPYRAGARPPAPPAAPELPTPYVPDPWQDVGGGNPYARSATRGVEAGRPFLIPEVFVRWIEAHGGFWGMGYCATGLFIPVETGVPTQFFEGGALEWHRGNPAEYRVLRRHTGLEALRALHPELVAA